jgi:hypothetical protein
MADTSTSDVGADVEDAGTADVSDAGAADAADAATCNNMWPTGLTNYITNATLESGSAAGWSASFGGGPLTATTTQAHCGSYSAELTGRTATYQGLFASMTPAATAGTYRVAVWVYQDGAATTGIAVQGRCADNEAGNGGNNFFGFVNAMIPPNTWTFVSGTIAIDAPTLATCQSPVTMVVNQQGGTAFPDLFVDDVFVGQ